MWQGHRFKFIACKDPSYSSITCYFYRLPLGNTDSSLSSLARLPSSPIDIIQSCGNFLALPSVSHLGLRLGLLISSASEGISLPFHDCKSRSVECGVECGGSCQNMIHIQIIEDVHDPNTGYCLTDGSGFISYNLAQLLPTKVIQGHIIQGGEGASISLSGGGMQANSHRSIPPVFQVRVHSPVGIFKGTVVVDFSNQYTRPHSLSLVLRRSMLKVMPTPPLTATATATVTTSMLRPLYQQVCIDVVNTSPISTSSSEFSRDVPTLTLSKHFILMLYDNGVPSHVFEYIARQQAGFIKEIRRARLHSSIFVQKKSQGLDINIGGGTSKSDLSNEEMKASKRFLSSLNDLSSHTFNDIYDMDRDGNIFPLAMGACFEDDTAGGGMSYSFNKGKGQGIHSTDMPIQQRIHSLLSAGHPISDPFISSLLSQLYHRCTTSLLQMRLCVTHSSFLIGIPDPTHSLLPNQVYIPGTASAGNGWSAGNTVLVGR